MTKPLISTCPRDRLYWIRPEAPHLVVSVTDPEPWSDGSRARLPDDTDRLDALHLQFCDFNRKHFEQLHEGRMLSDWAMKSWHASCIREFLENWRGKWRVLLVSCEAGCSRSPSIALAVAERLGISRHAIEPCGRNWDAQPLNKHVFELTRDALAASEAL